MTFNLDGNGPTPWTAELREEQQSSAPDLLPVEDTPENLMDKATMIVKLGGGSILAVYEQLAMPSDSDDSLVA